MGISYLSTFKDSKVINGTSWSVTSLCKKEGLRKLRNRHKEVRLRNYLFRALGKGERERQEKGPHLVLRLLLRKDWKTLPCFWDTPP